MLHYYVELAIWLLLAYLIGCFFGWFLRNIRGSVAPAATIAPVTPTAAVAPKAVASLTVVEPKPAMATPVLTPLPLPKPVLTTPAPPAPITAPKPVMLAHTPAPTPVRAPTPAPVPLAKAATPATPASAPSKMERPKGIAAARGGKADELQRMSGIGPKNEQILHTLGFFHFDQIANWTAKEQAWVDDHLRFSGRIIREEWVRQASLLASGKESEFNKEFGTGGLKGKDGKAHSGTQTRKS